jgi:hypothetical protein
MMAASYLLIQQPRTRGSAHRNLCHDDDNSGKVNCIGVDDNAYVRSFLEWYVRRMLPATGQGTKKRELIDGR